MDKKFKRDFPLAKVGYELFDFTTRKSGQDDYCPGWYNHAIGIIV